MKEFIFTAFSCRDIKDSEIKSLRRRTDTLQEEVEQLRKQLTAEKYERYDISGFSVCSPRLVASLAVSIAAVEIATLTKCSLWSALQSQLL